MFVQAPGTPGHHRTPSMDFKEMTRRDAESSLAMELDKLARTGTEARRELMDREFDGFKKLFGKFINESGPSVIWDNIERLPQNAVSINLNLSSSHSFQFSLQLQFETSMPRFPPRGCRNGCIYN